MTPWRYRHPYTFAALVFVTVWVGASALMIVLVEWFS